MPARLAEVVSRSFYGGQLRTAKRSASSEELRYVPVHGTAETAHEGSTSIFNQAEVTAAVDAAMELAHEHPDDSVVVLGLYSAQVTVAGVLTDAIYTLKSSTHHGSLAHGLQRILLPLLRHRFIVSPRLFSIKLP